MFSMHIYVVNLISSDAMHKLSGQIPFEGLQRFLLLQTKTANLTHIHESI